MNHRKTPNQLSRRFDRRNGRELTNNAKTWTIRVENLIAPFYLLHGFPTYMSPCKVSRHFDVVSFTLLLLLVSTYPDRCSHSVRHCVACFCHLRPYPLAMPLHIDYPLQSGKSTWLHTLNHWIDGFNRWIERSKRHRQNISMTSWRKRATSSFRLQSVRATVFRDHIIVREPQSIDVSEGAFVWAQSL
jgi:hypothetical protein